MISARRRGISGLLVVLSALGAACSFVRSLDGFSDDFGEETETGTDAQPATPDVSPVDAPLDTQPPADAPPDAGRPHVTCTLTTLTTFGGDEPKAAEYMSGLANGGNVLYVAAGSQDVDAGFGRDAGLVIRVSKKSLGVRRMADGLGAVRGCVAHPEGVACGVGTRIQLFLPDGGERTLLEAKESVLDLTPTTDGVFTAARGQSSSSIWYTPWSPGDASVRRTVDSVARVRVDDDAGFVFAGRNAALLSVYPRAAWDVRDAAANAEPDGCVVAKDTANAQLAVTEDGIAWITHSLYDLRTAGRSCNGSTRDVVDQFYALAADRRFLFVQRANDVQLRWADDISLEACTVPYVLATPGVTGSQTAVFDGDDVYFLSPPNLAMLHLTTVP